MGLDGHPYTCVITHIREGIHIVFGSRIMHSSYNKNIWDDTEPVYKLM